MKSVPGEYSTKLVMIIPEVSKAIIKVNAGYVNLKYDTIKYDTLLYNIIVCYCIV